MYIRDSIEFSERNDLVPTSLEMICVEISRLHSRSFLVNSWYRPPNSESYLFDEYKIFLQKCDLENK
jgi:hypothetical protein